MLSLRSPLTLSALSFSLALAGAVACAPADSTGDGDGDGDGDTATGGTAGDGDTATGGTAGDGDGDSSNELPADTTQAGIEAFLTAQTYRQAPWIGDAAVRAPESTVNVHGDELRVFFNTAAVAAVQTQASATGTMVVKEMYTAGELVGHAVAIKTGDTDTMTAWTFYCNAPAGSTLCTGSATSEPQYGVGLSECGFCHGQVPYAPLPQ